MKVQLPKAAREIFRVYGEQGGKAGSRSKKKASANARWAKAKAANPDHAQHRMSND